MLRAAIVSLFCFSAAAQESAGWTHSTLDGGVRLSVLRAPDAPRQSSFAFLRMGLSLDEEHRAQFSHLVEHMLLRQVDPVGLEVDGIAINGETSAELVRLEAIAPVDRWRDALEHQVKWLTERAFEDDELEREKQAIAQELRGTVASGYTHKWAAAAWNQVVRHGLDHAAVSGDVAEATVEQVRDYVDRRVDVATAHFFSVGPASPKDVAKALADLLAAHPPPAPVETENDAEKAGRRVTVPREHTATWDLPVRHYIEYYPVPDASAADRATAIALARSFLVPLAQQAGFRLASADLVDGHRRCLALSASLPEGVEVAAVREVFADVLAKAPRLAAPPMLARQIATQLEQVPDFAAQRERLKGHPRVAWLEANAALQVALHAQRLGLPMDRAAAAYREVDRDRVAALVEESLASDRRRSLLLVPAK